MIAASTHVNHFTTMLQSDEEMSLCVIKSQMRSVNVHMSHLTFANTLPPGCLDVARVLEESLLDRVARVDHGANQCLSSEYNSKPSAMTWRWPTNVRVRCERQKL